MRMSATVRAKAVDLAAEKIRRGLLPSIAIFRAIEEAGGDPVDSFNRSDVGRALRERRTAKERMAKRRAEYLDRLAKEAAADDKPWNR